MTDITNKLSIGAYIHCGRCVEEWKTGKAPGKSPAFYARLSVGWTRQGLQVWCQRHNCNVLHVDFEGHKHPADTTARAREWTVARYPGDSVVEINITRNSEWGSIRIQEYRPDCFRVGAFLPGLTTCLPGDTPKTEPDRAVIARTKLEAETLLERFLVEAQRDGWV